MPYSKYYYALLLIILLSSFGCEKKKTPQQIPPLPIPITNAVMKNEPTVMAFIGQVYGEKDIIIQARVNAFVKEVHFTQGDIVKEGQLLYTLEQGPFVAVVREAESALLEAKANLIEAESNYNRTVPLVKMEALSQSNLDDATAQLKNAKASVKSAEASLQSAQINLSYTKIKSPVTGIIGVTIVVPGNFVGPSSEIQILNTVSQVNEIVVEFDLPSSTYLKLGKENELKNPKSIFKDIRLELSNGEIYPHKGYFNFIDRNINPQTSSIMVEVGFPNPDNLLRPGQYAKIITQIGDHKDILLLPQKCINQLQNKYNVYVVNAKNEVEYRAIEVGEKVGANWIVLSGLTPKDKVVLSGMQKLHPGMVINPITAAEMKMKAESKTKPIKK